ncbi:MAG: hypothetical protein KDK70_17910 [Myxococcales bacterium]|nr:hypothetical protein [Myxococcales bacterium]
MSDPVVGRPRLARGASLLGLVLFGCIFLPLTPEGRTFVQVVIDTFAEGVFAGVVMVAGFGSPFVFGLAVALGLRAKDDATAASLVRTPVTMMHSQLLLVSWMIWRHGDAIASLPLLLFAVVSGLYVVQHSAAERAAGRHAAFRWYVRSGALVLVAVAGWLWLQRLAGFSMGVAVDVGGLCGLGLLLRSLPGRSDG